jgi:Skp family chaperone for outer membrane proteins
MKNNLVNSFVRGFGYTLGRSAANSVINSTSNSKSPSALSVAQQWAVIGITIIFALLIGVVLSNSGQKDFAIGASWIAVFTMWLPVRLFFRHKNRTKNSQVFEKLLTEFNKIKQEIESFPANITIEVDNQYDTIETNLSKIKQIRDSLKRLFEKYDAETAIRLYNGEFWIGMTREQILDIKGEPTSVETEKTSTLERSTLYYGGKRSGDVFKLENNVLVSFKDR